MYKFENTFVVAIIGPAGVGKSTLAKSIKDNIKNTAHVSVDHIKRYISEFREIQSHNKVSRRVTDVMIDEYLKNEISVVVDQGMGDEDIKKIKEIADQNQSKFLLYRIEAKPEIRLQRLKERSEKLNQPVMSQETMDILLKIYEETDYPGTATFNSGEMSVDEMKDKIIEDACPS